MLRHVSLAVCVLATGFASNVSVAASTVEDDQARSKGFRYYPSFVDRRGSVEAAHDKGLLLEIIIRCPDGSGIITYSKVEGLFCLTNHDCVRTLPVAVARLCH